ncbi:MAG: B12-binding domain-containing radical SAM protein [Desulfobaccales bacterium]
MDVLLICTNRNRHPAPVIPYGACLAADAAARAGHRVRVLDLMFAPRPLQAVEAALRSSAPDLVGLSVRNLDNNDMQAPVEFVTELATITWTVRQFSTAPLVLGGPAVGVMPEPLLRRTGADWAVLGDGETVFPLLLNALEYGGNVPEVPRLAWLEGIPYRTSLDTPCPLAPAATMPRFSRWLDLKAYAAALTAIPLQSKRGCPFSCIYCTYGISEGRGYRLLPPADVAAAVQRLSAMGLRDIEFVDNVFNSPYDHALALCDRLAAVRHGARLVSLELNPAFTDDRLLQSMKKAGFVGVGVTAESAADPVLAGLKKGYTAADLERAAAAIRRSPLPCFWIFLLGGPGETEATVMETLRFARRILRKGDVALLSVGIRIYPGTELEAMARQKGVLSLSAQEMLQPAFYFNPGLDLAWTLDQVRRAAAASLNIIHAGSLSHPWLPTVNRVFHRLPLRPLWRHTRAIRRVVRALGRDI